MVDNTNGLQNNPVPVQIVERDYETVQKQKRDMRSAFSRCGWATLALSLFPLFASLCLSFALKKLDQLGIDSYGFYNRFFLIFNEILIGSSIVFGLLFLLDMQKSVPERRKITAKSFFLPLCICFPISSAGNLLGTFIVMFWNIITGNNTTNELTEVLSSTSAWQMVLCVGIIAPIIEELFFRKLLIDRLYRYGELAAILISGLLFGLFHQNFNQFFYAAGIGIVFGFVYCRTGSYRLVILLHMAFNMVMGVLPSLVSEKVIAFLELIENTPFENIISSLDTIIPEYGLSLLLYGIHILASNALNVVGIILLIINLRKTRFNYGTTMLCAAEKRKCALVNAGMITIIIVLTLFMLLSLLPA